MNNRNFLSGLFPSLQSLDDSRGIEANAKTDDHVPEEHSEDTIGSSRQSLETVFLRELLSDFKVDDLSEYKAKLAEQKFYLSDRFVQKTGRLTTESKNLPACNKDAEEFQLYNKKVRREYALRNKMDSLIQRRIAQPLEVLSSEDLSTHFMAGKENTLTIPGIAKTRQRIANLVTSPLKSPTPIPELLLSRSHSYDTQIIDMERNLNGVIDDRQPGTYEYHKTSSISSALSSSGIRRKLPKLLSSSKRGSRDVYFVQRKLERRHLQSIAIGAAMGVGLFLNSGKALSIGGPLGFLIGFSICGSIVLATMLSFTEMATLIPISTGVSGLASRFVEDAFGFALGWTYWLTYALTLANQIVASNYMLSYYGNMDMFPAATAGFVTLFLVVSIAVNLLDVRIFGEIIYGFTFFKIVISTMMIIAMIILNAGAGRRTHPRVGFRYWDASKSPENLTYGLFRPTFDLRDTGTGSLNGIAGAKGRFLSVVLVIILSSFSYSGVEVGFVACAEAINPRLSLPSATKRTFITVVSLYLISIFMISLNIYSGDPRLLRYYTSAALNTSDTAVPAFNTHWQIDQICTSHDAVVTNGFTSGSQSPWVLALESFGLCAFSSVFNAFLVMFGVSSGFSSLYASSRTLYSMATQDKAPSVFKRCTSRGVPYAAVTFTGLFGALAYLALNSRSLEIFQALANISGATISIIWLGLNVSFLRLYYALKKRPDIISREDPSFPYKSPFQPFTACYGLFGSSLIVLLMGFSNFLHGFWSTKMVFSSYGGVIFFVVTFFGYKLLSSSKLQRLDQLDLDTGRREMDRMRWTEHREYSNSWREKILKLVTWMI
ncbi:LANO_0H05182g1_1 [Lachancea nothofagi CBS 11611]|uniref:LANO_0H05182g1_1 n=1 Tax=Lachancea nothofagi CBS 11611 TaxID=1266666 RepID=A0A1G4KLH6_9SACH|nr:LANO_0H05182g1_1 [Lachancea nothofagi CBS 11611]